MNTKIKLKYGSKIVKFDFNADDISFIRPSIQKPELSQQQIVSRSLDFPLRSNRIDNFLDIKDRILIIIPDKTRICGLKIILPLILRRINKCGIKNDRIKLIFANGSHPLQSQKEKFSLTGKKIYNKYSVLEHNAYDDKVCSLFGTTKYGTELFLNKIINETDKIITVGAVVHHYFAGYGGGAKFIMPGLANYKSIIQNHRRTLSNNGKINQFCQTANIEKNPVYMDLIESLKFCPPVFSINTVLNDNGKIIYCISGSTLHSHRNASKFVDKCYKIKIKHKSDLVIVSAGGYPKDINFIQSHKSIHNAYSAVKTGGVIIAFAECREGIGSKTFIKWFGFKDQKELRFATLKEYTLNTQTAISLMDKLSKVRIILISKLGKELTEKMGMIYASDFYEAKEIAMRYLDKNFNSYIIPNGSLTLPYIK